MFLQDPDALMRRLGQLGGRFPGRRGWHRGPALQNMPCSAVIGVRARATLGSPSPRVLSLVGQLFGVRWLHVFCFLFLFLFFLDTYAPWIHYESM